MRRFGSSKCSETLKHCLQQVLFPFYTHNNQCHFEIVLSFSTPGPHMYRKSDNLTCMWFSGQRALRLGNKNLTDVSTNAINRSEERAMNSCMIRLHMCSAYRCSDQEVFVQSNLDKQVLFDTQHTRAIILHSMIVCAHIWILEQYDLGVDSLLSWSFLYARTKCLNVTVLVLLNICACFAELNFQNKGCWRMFVQTTDVQNFLATTLWVLWDQC